VILTISREYGAAGLAVAEGVARALALELVTNEVEHAAAARLGTSSAEVAEAESGPPLAERLMRGFREATAETADPNNPILDFDESVRAEIEEAIRSRAQRGDVVFLGRFANAVLAGRPDIVRVFLYAERAWRVARIAEVFELAPERAASEVDRTDAERRTLAKDRYAIVWGGRANYDLIVNVGRLGIGGATRAIVAAATAARG
jgi:cytidylate kinase